MRRILLTMMLVLAGMLAQAQELILDIELTQKVKEQIAYQIDGYVRVDVNGYAWVKTGDKVHAYRVVNVRSDKQEGDLYAVLYLELNNGVIVAIYTVKSPEKVKPGQYKFAIVVLKGTDTDGVFQGRIKNTLAE